MRVGIVCEGRTDLALLEQVVLAVFGPCDINSIRPQCDSLGIWEPAGWERVKQWCERGVEQIADDMEIGGIDVLVVHIDGDLCGTQGLPETTEALCAHVQGRWLGGPAPSGLTICIPMQSTDTWLAAALDPGVSEQDDPLAHLVRLGVLYPRRPDEKRPRKSRPAYLEHAHELRRAAPTIRSTLPELGRFMGKLESQRPV